MSTRGTTFWDDDAPMEWVAESRLCPFDELPVRFCGCPEGERIMDERHLVRGEE